MNECLSNWNLYVRNKKAFFLHIKTYIPHNGKWEVCLPAAFRKKKMGSFAWMSLNLTQWHFKFLFLDFSGILWNRSQISLNQKREIEFSTSDLRRPKQLQMDWPSAWIQNWTFTDVFLFECFWYLLIFSYFKLGYSFQISTCNYNKKIRNFSIAKISICKHFLALS